MLRSSLRIVVSGLLAQYPLGGVAWDYVQYVLGFARLGHDVYYLEDTGQYPYNPIEGGLAGDCLYNVRHLANVMARFGIEDRWAYRFPWQSQWYGMPDERRSEIVRSADLVINVSGVLQNPWEYRPRGRLVYIDSDPVFTQVKLALDQAHFRKMVGSHDVHFSFGESLSDRIPVTGYRWRPTRQPVLLSEWHPSARQREVFTTVMNWTSFKTLQYRGESYGQKDVEFMRFLQLPARVAPIALELAASQGKERRIPRELLVYKGWHLVDPGQACPDLDGYRTYLETSKAEWSVAKQGYVLGQPGWFSGRSACYLAAGRPVVVQDTGFSQVLPTGEGILPFTDLEGAVSALNAVVSDYTAHALAARAVAEAHFDSDKVLTRLIEEAMAA